ncbi:hypothetical protein A584_23447 [Pseudomonas syringae pv. theae ICMP 3923]|nr:hypothetical protein A584_23447 [Pseudomonas syringae pv. theae ICMP 3923]
MWQQSIQPGTIDQFGRCHLLDEVHCLSFAFEKSSWLPGAALFQILRVLIGYNTYVLFHPLFKRLGLGRKITVFPLGLGQTVIQKHDRIVLMFWSALIHP